MSKTIPDVFTIRHREYGYTLEVGKMRPRNAPKYKLTKAEQKRSDDMARLNLELSRFTHYYPSLSDLVKKIEELEGGI